MTAPLDLTGERVGRLLVLGRVFDEKSGKRSLFLLVRCDCGTEKTVRLSHLRSGTTMSCGCLKRDLERNRAKHGQSQSLAYKSWSAMRQRCFNPRNAGYKRYGARGITVCDRWRSSFEAFLEDMGHRPSKKHSLDRIDPNGNYEPDNCRWALNKEQCRNKKNNRKITFGGETRSLSEWAERAGLRPQTIATRIDMEWPLEDALTRPKGYRLPDRKNWRQNRERLRTDGPQRRKDTGNWRPICDPEVEPWKTILENYERAEANRRRGASR